MMKAKLLLTTLIFSFTLSVPGFAQICKKLKVTAATAQEIIPGTAQGERSTDYRFEFKVKGNKPLTITSVCLSHGATTESLKYNVMDASGSNTVSTLEKGGSYQVVTNSAKKARGAVECDAFEGTALITYTYGGKTFNSRVKEVDQLEATTRR